MIKIYGMPTCPYCDFIYEQIKDRKDEFEYINIGEHISNLSAFMKLRDSSPVFDHCKEINDIGLPALIDEDGTVFLDWEGYLTENGLPIVYKERGPVCSLDGKGC